MWKFISFWISLHYGAHRYGVLFRSRQDYSRNWDRKIPPEQQFLELWSGTGLIQIIWSLIKMTQFLTGFASPKRSMLVNFAFYSDLQGILHHIFPYMPWFLSNSHLIRFVKLCFCHITSFFLKHLNLDFTWNNHFLSSRNILW